MRSLTLVCVFVVMIQVALFLSRFEKGSLNKKGQRYKMSLMIQNVSLPALYIIEKEVVRR